MLHSFGIDYTVEVVVILIALFVLSQMLRMFDVKGAIGAVSIGAIVSFLGNITWLVLLIVFAIVSHIATKYKFEFKKSEKFQEGNSGERKISNVAFGGIIGVIIAVANALTSFSFPYFVLFAAAFAAITSDTLASEIGILDTKTYMITTMKRVKTGINGGISVLGLFSSFLGSFTIAVSYIILTGFNNWSLPFLIILLGGFIGCQIDSVLGALFENRGKMSKGQVNLVASISSVLFCIPFLVFL